MINESLKIWQVFYEYYNIYTNKIITIGCVLCAHLAKSTEHIEMRFFLICSQYVWNYFGLYFMNITSPEVT